MNAADPEAAEAIARVQAGQMAYHAVSAAAAMAIQDAVASLRHSCAVATSASGMALAQFLATGDPRYLESLAQSQAMVDKATEHFAAVSAAAIKIVTEFPSE